MHRPPQHNFKVMNILIMSYPTHPILSFHSGIIKIFKIILYSKTGLCSKIVQKSRSETLKTHSHHTILGLSIMSRQELGDVKLQSQSKKNQKFPKTS